MLLSEDVIQKIEFARQERPRLRERDFAAAIGLTEAQVVAAAAGRGAVRIAADPARLMPRIEGLGDVMALTRNECCVHERKGVYSGWHAGEHAAMILAPEIDLRIFPRHWVHAFAVTRETEAGTRRSLQVFDAAGDAVHKIFLPLDADGTRFDALAAELALPAATPFDIAERVPVEPALANDARIDDLRASWARLTDTHQFLTLVRRLKMNRLGAYRCVGSPWARQLAPGAAVEALRRAAQEAIRIMLFVGNAGCIQIHSGTIDRLEPMGPWFNVMDPRFNLHLRADKVAEVWLVTKPTKRGPAVSIEAFDAEGGLILQVFGKRSEGATETRDWDRMTETLATEAVA